MSIQIEQLSYSHPNKDILFQNINFNLPPGHKASLIGNNGVGKSTFMKILCKELSASWGNIKLSSTPYYIPQHFGQYDHQTVYQALNIEKKINALQAILQGKTDQKYYDTLNDDWDIEQKAEIALNHYKLATSYLTRKMSELSGGEKSKIFLAGILIHQPKIILLDEPSNHLDYEGRKLLYKMIEDSSASILVISHDKALLNLLSQTYELSSNGITFYNGNYNFYQQQKQIEVEAQFAKLEHHEKELKNAKRIQQEVAERKQKLNARGKEHNVKKGVSKMTLNALRDRSEMSSAKLNDIHSKRAEQLKSEIEAAKNALDQTSKIKVDFDDSSLHKGKILVKAIDINYRYESEQLWQQPISFEIKSGDRISIVGLNGSGKTSLIRLITKQIIPSAGTLNLADFNYTYLDQEYSSIDNALTVYQQAQRHTNKLEEHQIKMMLVHSSLEHMMWNKPCAMLSGGEKMKLALCCLMIQDQQSDMLILDEPTNNIDLRNIDILISAIEDYRGTIVLVSHDNYLAQKLGIDKMINLE